MAAACIHHLKMPLALLFAPHQCLRTLARRSTRHVHRLWSTALTGSMSSSSPCMAWCAGRLPACLVGSVLVGLLAGMAQAPVRCRAAVLLADHGAQQVELPSCGESTPRMRCACRCGANTWSWGVTATQADRCVAASMCGQLGQG